jgi:hypothetical protein
MELFTVQLILTIIFAVVVGITIVLYLILPASIMYIFYRVGSRIKNGY